MSALYVMNFEGDLLASSGVVYVGKGIVVGVDADNIRFNGTYVESEGRIRGTIQMKVPAGLVLATGQPVPSATTFPLVIDWPVDFATQGPQNAQVPGGIVSVEFEKLGDIP